MSTSNAKKEAKRVAKLAQADNRRSDKRRSSKVRMSRGLETSRR